jgi:hypothetical protein
LYVTPILRIREAAQKHPEGSFKVINALAMAAGYDPDRTQFLGIRLPAVRFACDSPLEGDGFEPSVPGTKEPVLVAEGELRGPTGQPKGLFLTRYRWFESISLQRRVRSELRARTWKRARKSGPPLAGTSKPDVQASHHFGCRRNGVAFVGPLVLHLAILNGRQPRRPLVVRPAAVNGDGLAGNKAAIAAEQKQAGNAGLVHRPMTA